MSIIGAGFTGKQLASWIALHGYEVNICDSNPDVLIEALNYISEVLKRKKRENLINEIHRYNEISKAVSNADIVIETVNEDVDTKKGVFSQIDKHAPSHAIIASNSSSIPVSRIEDVVKRKDKVLNLHFYPPIPKWPMIDIMKGTQTTDISFQTGIDWIESIGCTPLVVKKESVGFVFNRVWRAVKKECIDIWAGGYADIEVVDKAWKIFTGMNMGPFTIMDAIGLDVVYAVEKTYFRESGNLRDRPPQEFKDIVKRGDLGMKSGKGFYTWKSK